jgi:hypothetical protein
LLADLSRLDGCANRRRSISAGRFAGQCFFSPSRDAADRQLAFFHLAYASISSADIDNKSGMYALYLVTSQPSRQQYSTSEIGHETDMPMQSPHVGCWWINGSD